jgi:hypothetical protein
MMAELYFFSAVSLGTIRGLEEGIIKVLSMRYSKTGLSHCHMSSRIG